jgi:hypothetical protein
MHSEAAARSVRRAELAIGRKHAIACGFKKKQKQTTVDDNEKTTESFSI